MMRTSDIAPWVVDLSRDLAVSEVGVTLQVAIFFGFTRGFSRFNRHYARQACYKLPSAPQLVSSGILVPYSVHSTATEPASGSRGREAVVKCPSMQPLAYLLTMAICTGRRRLMSE